MYGGYSVGYFLFWQTGAVGVDTKVIGDVQHDWPVRQCRVDSSETRRRPTPSSARRHCRLGSSEISSSEIVFIQERHLNAENYPSWIANSIKITRASSVESSACPLSRSILVFIRSNISIDLK